MVCSALQDNQDEWRAAGGFGREGVKGRVLRGEEGVFDIAIEETFLFKGMYI